MKNIYSKIIFFLILISSFVLIFAKIKQNNFTDEEKNQTIENTAEDRNNPKPSFPSILPSSVELSQKLFSSNLAILCMYFIQVVVYLYKEKPNKLQYPMVDIENILSLNTFLPENAKVVELLTYTCSKNLKTYYGGFIIEYILNSKITSFIVMRGTQESCEWGEDFNTKLINPVWLKEYSNIKVHNGFNNIYTSKFSNSPNLREQIWNYINKNTFSNLVVTGHSLGGGLCYLFAADITKNRLSLRNNTKIFSFAGPYAGNKEFVDLILSVDSTPIYSGIFSIINTQDAVPNTKLSNYVRIQVQTFCFFSSGNWFKKGSVHFPATYMKGLLDNKYIFDKNSPYKAACGKTCNKYNDKQKIFILIMFILILEYLLNN
jgi:ABC-type cobalt transport system substrate-binding protein